jgi:hypothetical protein
LGWADRGWPAGGERVRMVCLKTFGGCRCSFAARKSCRVVGEVFERVERVAGEKAKGSVNRMYSEGKAHASY